MTTSSLWNKVSCEASCTSNLTWKYNIGDKSRPSCLFSFPDLVTYEARLLQEAIELFVSQQVPILNIFAVPLLYYVHNHRMYCHSLFVQLYLRFGKGDQRNDKENHVDVATSTRMSANGVCDLPRFLISQSLRFIVQRSLEQRCNAQAWTVSKHAWSCSSRHGSCFFPCCVWALCSTRHVESG